MSTSGQELRAGGARGADGVRACAAVHLWLVHLSVVLHPARPAVTLRPSLRLSGGGAGPSGTLRTHFDALP
ncbi:hypothetical protein [Pseudonocardia sp. MH-G8]|uniref:hypothetical protein n=1 Tax=Pseudonocardia sp. MH-G8 TaxID=1854588 RepID=UPI001E3406EA|nr:hypothetical protein [Pseudonocardia sp. MH-G8]